mmetsp:Transcript_6162/g.10943  ORF Transcript_6162/g.10943 Transcript_6162/m.10943 type:complete len:245 (-) Transcript_6162:162-896(-)
MGSTRVSIMRCTALFKSTDWTECCRIALPLCVIIILAPPAVVRTLVKPVTRFGVRPVFSLLDCVSFGSRSFAAYCSSFSSLPLSNSRISSDSEALSPCSSSTDKLMWSSLLKGSLSVSVATSVSEAYSSEHALRIACASGTAVCSSALAFKKALTESRPSSLNSLNKRRISTKDAVWSGSCRLNSYTAATNFKKRVSSRSLRLFAGARPMLGLFFSLTRTSRSANFRRNHLPSGSAITVPALIS